MQNLDSVSEKFRTKLRNNMGGLVLFLFFCSLLFVESVELIVSFLCNTYSKMVII